MTLQQFKTETRLSRGKLTNHDQDLEDIYTLGVPGLVYFTMDRKLMGIANIAHIAQRPKEYQVKFLTWMADKGWKATKNELELRLSDD